MFSTALVRGLTISNGFSSSLYMSLALRFSKRGVWVKGWGWGDAYVFVYLWITQVAFFTGCPLFLDERKASYKDLGLNPAIATWSSLGQEIRIS